MARGALSPVSILRTLAVVAGVAVLAVLTWEVGATALFEQARALGWRLPLLLLPYALVAVLDATGWRYAFPERLPSLPRLVLARLAGEAINVTTPTATLGGEPIKAWLLTRAGIPLTEGLVSVVVAKTALVISHLAFVGTAVGLAAWRVPPAPAILTAMALLTAVGVVAIVGFVWAQRRGLFRASSWGLARLGLRPALIAQLHALDGHLVTFYERRRGRLALSCLFHFLGWMAGAVEVWVALTLLGSPVDPATALVIEAFASAVRSATFLIPGSLGAQEGGFVAVFLGYGLSASTGLAFGLLRRLREALWAAIGFTVLAAWGGGSPRGAPAGPRPTP
jgi:putative membrane protein